ncbi:DNA-methyltransferase [Bacteroidota bacterium]
MINFPLPRLDKDKKLYKHLVKYCRLRNGEIWNDTKGNHIVGCLDACDYKSLKKLVGRRNVTLAIQDPPYNIIAFKRFSVSKFIDGCKAWVDNTFKLLSENSSLYVWLGADQRNHYEPFVNFAIMMKDSGFNSKNFITMRNQRGYGTQKNWMSIRQELLYYTKGSPVFNINKVYTEIPKLVKGYYKEVSGRMTENIERSKSDNIRAGNVWIDIQQVFHLLEENVNGCYAQKPLKAIERIIDVSTAPKQNVIDFFSHSGTTLLACERLNRKCITVDIDPIYCEISIRRLERFRKSGKIGWQNSNPFHEEILNNKLLKNYLVANYNLYTN